MSAATTRATLERLRSVRDSGATETVVDGVTVKFRTQKELDALIVRLERQLGLRQSRARTLTPYMGHR